MRRKHLSIVLSILFLAACTPKSEAPQPIPASEYEKEYTKQPYNNVDREARIAGLDLHSTDFNPNPLSGKSGDVSQYIYEPLYIVNTVTGERTPRLAESLTHFQNTSTLVIRTDRMWNDGTALTAKDIWAYYILMGSRAETNSYLDAINVVSDNTLEFVWQSPVPSYEMRDLLLSEGCQGTVQYEYFKQFVDTAMRYISTGQDYTGPANERPAFGVQLDDSVKIQEASNFELFLFDAKTNPIGTGPYVLEDVDAIEVTLGKNKFFPNYADLPFFKLRLTGEILTDRLVNSSIELFYGTTSAFLTNNILEGRNKVDIPSLVVYSVPESKAVGLIFNSKRLLDQKIRQAICFGIDRPAVTEAANSWAKPATYGSTGILPSYIDKALTSATLEKLTKYEPNPVKVSSLLTDAGCVKENGIWLDASGKAFDLVIGANESWAQGVSASKTIASQLTELGIPTNAVAVPAEDWRSRAAEGEFDITVDFTDCALNTFDPIRTLATMYNVDLPAKAFLPSLDSHLSPDYTLKDFDDSNLNIVNALEALPYADNELRQDLLARLAWATNESCCSFTLYQSYSTLWLNTATTKGFPLEKQLPVLGKIINTLSVETDLAEISDYMLFSNGQQFIDTVLRPR